MVCVSLTRGGPSLPPAVGRSGGARVRINGINFDFIRSYGLLHPQAQPNGKIIDINTYESEF